MDMVLSGRHLFDMFRRSLLYSSVYISEGSVVQFCSSKWCTKTLRANLFMLSTIEFHYIKNR